jgi:hypothetical protein
VILYRLHFAVPAFIVLAAALVMLVTLILLTLTQKPGLGRMCALLEATSAGRIMGMSLWPEKRMKSERKGGRRNGLQRLERAVLALPAKALLPKENLVEEAEEEASIEHGDGATDRVSETKTTSISET